ncbi:MAG TPA: amidohydrolase family protein [Clostridiales bacterium]|nr:amidohydrolase family protein [Clostridiales bacterium]
MQRKYIDIHAAMGRTNFKEPEIPYTAEQLKEEMAYYRMHGALITSQNAKDYSPVMGNKQVLKAVSENPRLFAAAVIIPDFRFEMREGETYLQTLADAGVRAFKMYPSAFQHGFDPFTLEETAEFMAARNIPLMVNAYDVKFEDIRQVLSAFPKLNIVMCNAYWSANRQVFPMMERFENLYMDISGNQANDILPLCKQYFGVDRVLFGSDYPNKVTGGIKALVEYSGLSEEEKNKVAAENAAKLFRIDLDALPLYEESKCRLDTLAKKMDEGRPLSDVLVIDAHTHMVDGAHEVISSTPIYHGDADAMVQKMDSLGIDTILVSPWEGITTVETANETAQAACEKYPGRVLAYATYNPHYPEDLEKVIEFYHEECRFVGIKPYPPHHKLSLKDTRYERWFAYGNENRLLMLIHADNPDTIRTVDELSEVYPEISFILAHGGMSYPIARKAAEVAKKRANVYVEITYTALTNGVVEYLVAEAGADKVLYGSDMPMRDPAPQLAWVCYAKIPEADKRKILGGNAKRLLMRCFTKGES